MIGFGRRLIAASVTPTITDSDSALLGCGLLPGKNYVFWLRVWKNAWMTPPSHTARPLPPPQSEQFLGGANSCHRCLYRPENCLVPQSDMIFDFISKMPDMLTQISKHWVWFVSCVWSFFLGYLILGLKLRSWPSVSRAATNCSLMDWLACLSKNMKIMDQQSFPWRKAKFIQGVKFSAAILQRSFRQPHSRPLSNSHLLNMYCQKVNLRIKM